ncbi:MAG: hypothetical protein R6V67_02875, partial [Spirochaetia bacterium]
MKYRLITTIFITLLVFTAAAFTVGAQDLLRENEYYEEAQELKREAEQALEDGEYDRATELSEEASELFDQAESYAENQVR